MKMVVIQMTTVVIQMTTVATQMTAPATQMTAPAIQMTPPAIQMTAVVTQMTAPATQMTAAPTQMTTAVTQMTTEFTQMTTVVICVFFGFTLISSAPKSMETIMNRGIWTKIAPKPIFTQKARFLILRKGMTGEKRGFSGKIPKNVGYLLVVGK